MPEVTDLQKVAQYAKSSGAPSDVYNAACRLLDEADLAAVVRDAHGLAEKLFNSSIDLARQTGRAEAEAAQLRYERDALRCEVARFRTAQIEREAAKTATESHGDGRTPQTLRAGEGQATTEAHGAVDVRPTSMRRRVDFDTNGDPQ